VCGAGPSAGGSTPVRAACVHGIPECYESCHCTAQQEATAAAGGGAPLQATFICTERPQACIWCRLGQAKLWWWPQPASACTLLLLSALMLLINHKTQETALLLCRAVCQRCPACPLQLLLCCHRLTPVLALPLLLIIWLYCLTHVDLAPCMPKTAADAPARARWRGTAAAPGRDVRVVCALPCCLCRRARDGETRVQKPSKMESSAKNFVALLCVMRISCVCLRRVPLWTTGSCRELRAGTTTCLKAEA
jgi:hypothetical protein